MFSNCFCLPSKKGRSKTQESKYLAPAISLLSERESYMLELIYEDLSSRNRQRLLGIHEFLSFFSKLGRVWGQKTYQCFVHSSNGISKREFLSGVEEIVKTNLTNKINHLYNFFDPSPKSNISYINFLRMLSNFRPDEIFEAPYSTSSNCLNLTSSKKQKNKSFADHERSFEKDREFNQVENQKNAKKSFDFQNIEEITKTVFQKFQKNSQDPTHLTFENFAKWIVQNRKFMTFYYSSFRQQIWSDSQDSLISWEFKNLSFQGKYESMGKSVGIYGVLVDDILILFEIQKKKKRPFKIICLKGLTVQVKSQNKVQVYEKDSFYYPFNLRFETENEQRKWGKYLKLQLTQDPFEKYEIGKQIGHGHFSTVCKCHCKETGQCFAIKIKKTGKQSKSLDNEGSIIQILNHEHIVSHKQTFYTKKKEYIITQMIDGMDLFEYVKKKERLKEHQAVKVIKKIIRGVVYLQKLGILHRDLKPENIMLEFSNEEKKTIKNVKIVDFGLSQLLCHAEKLSGSQAIGTPNYIAPQLIEGQQITLKADNFSIGAVLYFILTGKLPFEAKNSEKTLLNTIRGSYNRNHQAWQEISNEGRDMITRLMQKDPSKRINLEEALSHEWLCLTEKRTSKKDEDSRQTLSKTETIENSPSQFPSSEKKKIIPSKVSRRFSIHLDHNKEDHKQKRFSN